jgi:hypothetical protein
MLVLSRKLGEQICWKRRSGSAAGGGGGRNLRHPFEVFGV